MANTGIFMKSDASVIDRKVENLVGNLSSKPEDRQAIVAEINELSASRTRMMRPRQRRWLEEVDRRSVLLKLIEARQSTREKSAS